MHTSAAVPAYNANKIYPKFTSAQLMAAEALIQNDRNCKAADAAMETIYGEARSRLAREPSKRDALKADQQNWLCFRTTALSSFPLGFRGTVFVELTNARSQTLRSR